MNRRTWIAGALAAAVAGCQTAPPPRTGSGPLPTAAEALERLRQAGAQRRTLKAEGRVTYYGEQGRVRVRMEVVARRADQFRVATISPFEQPIDVMTCDGRELWLLSKGELKRGPATPTNVARLLPLPLAPSAIVDTLMGGIPTGPGFRATAVEIDDAGGWTLVVDRDGSVERMVLSVDPGRWVVTAATIERPRGEPYLRAVFDDFMAVPEGGFYPERIKMTMPGRDVDVRMKLKRPVINAEIDASLFRIVPPPGKTVRSL